MEESGQIIVNALHRAAAGMAVLETAGQKGAWLNKCFIKTQLNVGEKSWKFFKRHYEEIIELDEKQQWVRLRASGQWVRLNLRDRNIREKVTHSHSIANALALEARGTLPGQVTLTAAAQAAAATVNKWRTFTEQLIDICQYDAWLKMETNALLMVVGIWKRWLTLTEQLIDGWQCKAREDLVTRFNRIDPNVRDNWRPVLQKICNRYLRRGLLANHLQCACPLETRGVAFASENETLMESPLITCTRRALSIPGSQRID